MAPVVHLQDGLRHGHTLHAGLELPVERHAGRIQVLVVHPDGQHKVAELPLRHLPAHFLAGLERGPHLVQVVRHRIIHRIRQRHVRIQELQRFLFGKRWPVGAGHDGLVIPSLTGNLREAGQRTPVRRHPGVKVLLHPGAVRRVRHKMLLAPAGAGSHGHQNEPHQRSLEQLLSQYSHSQLFIKSIVPNPTIFMRVWNQAFHNELNISNL